MTGRFKKWIDLSLVVTALIAWFLVNQLLEQVWVVFRLPLYPDLPMPLSSILAAVMVLPALVLVRRSQKIYGFLDEVSVELSKVTWPNGRETALSTGVIIIMVGIAASILFLFDTIWGTLTRSFLAI